MEYKTTVLGLLQVRPLIYDQLLLNRTLLATLDRYATELRTSHHSWHDRLAQARPGSDPSQIASEALEIALQELEDRLSSGSPPTGSEAFPIEAAMALITHHTPPA